MTVLITALTGLTILNVPSPMVTPEGVAGIARGTTRQELALVFDGARMEETTENLGEGQYLSVTVIYPGTDYELAVFWNEEGTPMEVRMRGGYWRTPEGIGLGSTLTELEEAVGGFELLGYAWDNEGYALLWDTPYEGLFIRLLPEGGESPAEFMGDIAFPSSLLRGLNPVVTDFRVRFD